MANIPNTNGLLCSIMKKFISVSTPTLSPNAVSTFKGLALLQLKSSDFMFQEMSCNGNTNFATVVLEISVSFVCFCKIHFARITLK